MNRQVTGPGGPLHNQSLPDPRDELRAERDALAARLASVEALVEEARMDNADLARQLTDASRRRADAFDEGYDKAMSDAHSVLNQRGYLERCGDDSGNPYRATESGQA